MRHAVTLEKLARYLERNDWSYSLVQESQLIRTSFRGKNAVFEVLIVFDDRRGRVRFVLPNLFVLPPNRVNAEILTELLALNMRFILVKFGYDPEDGEVRVEVDVPIEGGDLTFESFQRSLFSLLSVADEVHPKLSQLIYGPPRAERSEPSKHGASAPDIPPRSDYTGRSASKPDAPDVDSFLGEDSEVGPGELELHDDNRIPLDELYDDDEEKEKPEDGEAGDESGDQKPKK